MGIIGLPGAGKSTIHATLASERAGSAPVTPDKPRVTVVKVPDERVDWLSAYYKPKSTVFTDLEFVDFAALRSKGQPGETFGAAFVGNLRAMDGLLVTVRGFSDPVGGDPPEGIDPARDLVTIAQELVLADLQVVETRREKIAKNVARGMKEEAKELELLDRIKAALEAEQPLAGLELRPDELKLIRGYALLTLKPAVILLNLDEAQFREAPKHVAALGAAAKGRPVLPLSARIEEEIAHLSPEDQKMFLDDLGLKQTARARLILQCFELLGLICFFTVGEDEVRAWTLGKGETALRAAGRIHSDLERGFIRAEVFAFDDLKRLGDVPSIKKEGRWRLEGKEYQVKDGDCLCIRFNA